MTRTFDDAEARRRDALYKSANHWILRHPLEEAIAFDMLRVIARMEDTTVVNLVMRLALDAFDTLDARA